METNELNRSGAALTLLIVLVCCTGQTCESDRAARTRGGAGPELLGALAVGDPNELTIKVTPEDLTLDCAGADNAAALASWLASAEAVAPEGCDPVTVVNDYDETFDVCDPAAWSTLVTWTATDNCAASVDVSATLTILAPAPPVITLNGDATVIVERGVDMYVEMGAVASFGCGIGEADATVGGDTVDDQVNGEYTVAYDATDPCGNAADTATRTVRVVDPPVFTFVPADLELDCADPNGIAMALDDWLNSATALADPLCGNVTVTGEFAGLAETCQADAWSFEVVWTAEDECGLLGTAIATLVLLNADDPPPLIALNGDESAELECKDEYEELGATVTFECAGIAVPATVGGDLVDAMTPGTYVVTYLLADDCGHSTETLMRTVTVVDTAAPDLVLGGASELWPPNHMYHSFSLSDCVAEAFDACEGELDVATVGTILSISSDEVENGIGDGNTDEDIVIVDDTTFMLRSERAGPGNGRVYVVTFEVTDSEGNASMGTCTFAVPHDQSGMAAVDDGPAYEVTP